MARMGERWWMEYMNWLLRRVGFEKKGYGLLMEELHNTEFVWVIERDKNRAGDGINLRDEFLEGVFDYSSESIIGQPCSVLEMLVAFSIRIDAEYTGAPGDPHPEKIFWEMICNLELNYYDDKAFGWHDIYQILDTWLNRDFDPDGKGSIFPLRKTHRDQRDLEIWSQMQEYLSERY